MSKWICRYCREDTSNVDYDYLVGTDHLACMILSGDDKPIKIENWDKLDNKVFQIGGLPMRVSGTQIVESRYTIHVYEMVDGECFVRVDLWADNLELSVKIFPPTKFTSVPIHLERYVVKEHLKDPTIFLNTVENLVTSDKEVNNFLKYLRERYDSKSGITGLSGSAGKFAQTFGTSSLW